MTPACDAYSGGCPSLGTTVVPTATPPAVLVRTGPTGGDLVLTVLLGSLLVLAGVLLLVWRESR